MKCRNCDSDNLEFSKWITWGENAGKSYHYRCKCLDCKKSYHVERNKEVFEEVKNLSWRVSKTTINHLKRQGKTIKDLY